jgi:hypothetical protein
MATRDTACSCGQLNLTIEDEPAPISMCPCLAPLSDRLAGRGPDWQGEWE